jgi:glucose-6-phosphate-specific signal transduction histidine kinase
LTKLLPQAIDEVHINRVVDEIVGDLALTGQKNQRTQVLQRVQHVANSKMIKFKKFKLKNKNIN